MPLEQARRKVFIPAESVGERKQLPIQNLELGRMKKAAFIKKDSWIEFHSNTQFGTVDLSNCRNQVLRWTLSLWFNSFSHFALFIPWSAPLSSFLSQSIGENPEIHSSWRLCAKRLWEKGAARLLVVLDRETLPAARHKLVSTFLQSS